MSNRISFMCVQGGLPGRDSEYERCGTANVFCGVQSKARRHFTKPTANRSSPQFADYLLEIAASYPEADTIHRVMDNLSSHNRKALVDRFGRSSAARYGSDSQCITPQCTAVG